jgi:hypothetical protein
MTKFQMRHRVVTDVLADDIDVYDRVVDLLTDNLGPRFTNMNARSHSSFWDNALRNYNMVRGKDIRWITLMGQINGSRAHNWMCYELISKAFSGRTISRELVVVVDDDAIAVQLRLMLS